MLLVVISYPRIELFQWIFLRLSSGSRSFLTLLLLSTAENSIPIEFELLRFLNWRLHRLGSGLRFSLELLLRLLALFAFRRQRFQRNILFAVNLFGIVVLELDALFTRRR